MNFRKITSLTLLISLVFCALTSMILYIKPEGRVAYWANWQLMGLSKTDWSDLHVNLGFLFLLMGMLHLVYNWSAIATYLKNRARRLQIFTPSFIAAMILILVVGIGTWGHIPPFSWVQNLGDTVKDAAAQKYGEPPYGHAELSSLSSFCKKAEIDQIKAQELLREAGIMVDNEKQTIALIAASNHLTPKALYDIIKPASITADQDPSTFPSEPEPGFGQKTLAEICAEYHLQTSAVVDGLAGENITARPEQTIRDIARMSNMAPQVFFSVLHRVVTQHRVKAEEGSALGR